MSKYFLIVFLLLIISACGNTAKDFLDDFVSNTKTLRYGDHNSQFTRLRIPNSKPPALGYPVIIIIHGGCWREEFNLGMTAPLAEKLRELGYATLNVEYRRIGNGGEYPNMFNDISGAARSLSMAAAKFELNLNKVIVIGHSAGGHLALWLASNHIIPNTSQVYVDNKVKILGGISIGGITDLRSSDACEKLTTESLIGIDNRMTQEELDFRFRETSPKDLLPISKPTRVIIGSLDEVIPISQATSYVNRANNYGEDIKLISWEGLYHMDIIDPEKIPISELTKEIDSILEK